jgi:tetratricopeptide (TPR) repeat protein
VSDALYERYKDALRRGHVAALRGRLDAALVAYGEAAEIAPERPLPHASLGAVLMRLGKPDDALVAYGTALDRAPADETALAGRAEVLASLGRRVEAAEALDRLADVQDAAGRLPEACDTARRALELAESKARRRHVAELARRVREMPANEAAAAAAERAERVLEPVGMSVDVLGEPEVAPATPADGGTLAARAEERIDVGETGEARDLLIAAARAHRTAGEHDAALDACYLALAIVPADGELHLLLAELYLDRGWRAPATEKLLLLDRLVGLGEDGGVRERIRELAGERLPDEPRLAPMIA